MGGANPRVTWPLSERSYWCGPNLCAWPGESYNRLSRLGVSPRGVDDTPRAVSASGIVASTRREWNHDQLPCWIPRLMFRIESLSSSKYSSRSSSLLWSIVLAPTFSLKGVITLSILHALGGFSDVCESTETTGGSE